MQPLYFTNAKAVELFQLIPKNDFNALCEKWEVNKGVKVFCAAQHLQTLVTAYLLKLESLREIELTLGISRSTLSDANATRPSGFFQELCDIILNKIIQLSNRKIRQAARTVLAIDSTECQIHGSVSKIKKWARNPRGKPSGPAAAKLHVVWNVDNEWIEDFRVTAVRVHDMAAARKFKIRSGCHYVFDRAYNDLSFWWEIASKGSHFVTRLKKTTVSRMRIFSILREKKDATGVLWDGPWKPHKGTLFKHSAIPKDVTFRQIIYRDANSKNLFHFITSDHKSEAQEIANYYKKRWAVELLFRWLKGHLKIRYIPFKNKNAIKVQLALVALTQLLIQLDRLSSGFKGTLWERLRSLRVDLLRSGIHGSTTGPLNSEIPRAAPGASIVTDAFD